MRSRPGRLELDIRASGAVSSTASGAHDLGRWKGRSAVIQCTSSRVSIGLAAALRGEVRRAQRRGR